MTVHPPAADRDPSAAPWADSYPVGVPASYPYPDVPAARLLDDAAQDFPDAVAIEYHRHRLSYRKLRDHTDRFATALAAGGVGAGDTVAVLLPNRPQLVITVFATWRLGASVVLPDEFAARVAAAAAPTVVVTTPRRFADQVAPVRSRLRAGTEVVVARRSEYLPFPRNVVAPLRAALADRAPVAGTGDVRRFADLVRRNLPDPDEAADAAACAAIDRAGPTVSQRNLVVNSFQLRLWLPDIVAGDERVLLAVPVASVGGLVWLLTSVLSAATMILVDDARPAQRQRAAFRSGPTIVPLDGRTVDELLRASWRRGHLRSTRIAVSTGPLPAEAATQLEELTDKGRVRRAWGPDGVLTHADPIYGRVEPDSVGLPLPDTDVTLATDDGTPVPVGAGGHVWVRGPQLRADRWVDTGVDGRLTTDGYLAVRSRGPASGGD